MFENSISPEISFLKVSFSLLILILFCFPSSRFRIVTSWFLIESLSTVMQNGVPISSFRAYRLPTEPESSYSVFHSCLSSLWMSFDILTSCSSFFTSGKTAALNGASFGFSFRTMLPFSFSV